MLLCTFIAITIISVAKVYTAERVGLISMENVTLRRTREEDATKRRCARMTARRAGLQSKEDVLDIILMMFPCTLQGKIKRAKHVCSITSLLFVLSRTNVIDQCKMVIDQTKNSTFKSF